MKRYFVTLSANGIIEIPKPLIEKLCWYERTTLYQFVRGSEIFITDNEPEDIDNTPCESQLGESGRLNILKELFEKVGIGIGTSIAVYMFYDGILGLTKDFRECAVCGKENELSAVRDKYICYDCALEISGIEDKSFE